MGTKLRISGWGNVSMSNAYGWEITTDNLLEVKSFTGPYIPRGRGRAYGDASTIENGRVINTGKLDKIILFDETLGICKVQCGVTFEKLIQKTLNTQWRLPVVPGSRYISMGGALASDVHGKNHYKMGTFSDHVLSFNLLLANGEVINVTRTSEEELFSATAGGMGLTGVILEMDIQLINTKSNTFLTCLEATSNWTETLNKLKSVSLDSEYAIAWIDFSSSKKFGRSIIFGSNQLETDIVAPLTTPRLITIPRIPFNLVSRPLIKVFNSIRYSRLKKLSNDRKIKQSIWEVLFPSDIFNFWNRLFGPKGLMEYQFIFESKNAVKVEELLREIIKVVNPALCAVKILGPKNKCFLSFPTSGFLVGVTFPWKKSLAPFVDSWDQKLVALGSRKYLSKDVLTKKEVIEDMYPELQTFLEVCKKFDPEEKINSDLSLRLIR